MRPDQNHRDSSSVCHGLATNRVLCNCSWTPLAANPCGARRCIALADCGTGWPPFNNCNNAKSLARRPTRGTLPSLLVHNRRAVVLLAVLVVVAILILAGYGFIGLMNAEFEAAHSSSRLADTRALAESGLHYAAFVLGHPEAVGLNDGDDSIVVSPLEAYDNPSGFYNVPLARSNPQQVRQGYFSIIAHRDLDDPQYASQAFRFGVEDESAKININALLKIDSTGERVKETLLKVPSLQMTPEIAESVLNWMRAANTGGASAAADSAYYSSAGYRAKNGPFESLEELLFVRGVTPRQLLGNDQNRNGILEPEEDDAGGILDPGWMRYITIYSRERNLDAQGQPRTYINDDLERVGQRLGETLGEEAAMIITLYRQYGASLEPPKAKSKPKPTDIKSFYELLLLTPEDKSDDMKAMIKSFLDPATQRKYLPVLLDKFSTTDEMELPPRINVNTAAREVLAALPGMDEASVQKIMENRPSPNTDPTQVSLYRTPAWLVTEAKLEPKILQQIEPFVTTRPQVFRMQIVGYYDSGGPTVRLEAVIDANYGRPRILYWRDITELGKGYDFRNVIRQ